MPNNNILDLAILGLERNDNSISIADAKAGLLLAFVSLLVSLFPSQITQATKILIDCQSSWVVVIASIGLILLLLGTVTVFIFSFLAVFPRLSPSKPSLIYFGTIGSLSSCDEFTENFKNISPLEEITSQLYSTSKILNKKYMLLKISFISTFITTIGLIIILLVTTI